MNARLPTVHRFPSRALRLSWALATLGVVAAPGGPAPASQGKAPPAPEKLRVHPDAAWSRKRDFTVDWSNPSHPRAIAVAYYRLCPVEAQRRCKDGKRREPGVHGLRVTVPDVGDHTLTVWLKDSGGHVNPRHRSRAVHLRFDDQPPTSDGLERDVDGDPTLLEVAVRDELSGPGRVEVQLRPRGGGSWRALSTSDDEAKRVRARIPDLDLPDGEYEVRALIRDRAGNRVTIGGDGHQPMSVRLPVRRRTSISATLQRNAMTRSCRATTTRVAGRPRTLRRCREVALRASVPLPTQAPLALRRAERPQIVGSARGLPRGASVEVVERARTPGAAARTSRVQVDAAGAFRLWLEPGPSRTVELSYPGDARTLPSRLAATVLVPAASTLMVNRRSVLNRQSVLFSGRLLGGPIPAIGRTVDLQAHYRGAWRTFATPRADATGAWRYRYRFGASPGRISYPFRVLVQRDAGYPYETGVSRTVRVSVRGR